MCAGWTELFGGDGPAAVVGVTAQTAGNSGIYGFMPKLVADHAYDGQNIDFYLSYVKKKRKRDTALPSWRNLSAISQNTVSFIK